MGSLHLVEGKPEIDRRRSRLDPSTVVEVWPDLDPDRVFWLGDDALRRVAYQRPGPPDPGGRFWMGDAAKVALDQTGDAPMPALLRVGEEVVPIYYGPHLRDLESLPVEESLRARVLSARGIAALWSTYDAEGQRRPTEPGAPTDPVFFLRRPRTGAIHTWRLFRARLDACQWVERHLAGDAEASRWATAIPAADFDDLLARFGRSE